MLTMAVIFLWNGGVLAGIGLFLQRCKITGHQLYHWENHQENLALCIPFFLGTFCWVQGGSASPIYTDQIFIGCYTQQISQLNTTQPSINRVCPDAVPSAALEVFSQVCKGSPSLLLGTGLQLLVGIFLFLKIFSKLSTEVFFDAQIFELYLRLQGRRWNPARVLGRGAGREVEGQSWWWRFQWGREGMWALTAAGMEAERQK